jgi:hypothetical protein
MAKSIKTILNAVVVIVVVVWLLNVFGLLHHPELPDLARLIARAARSRIDEIRGNGADHETEHDGLQCR